MPRILLLATTTGYQTRAFGEAATASGAELVFATDRCGMLEDPWRDGAIPIRFHDEDSSVAAIVEAARVQPIHGVLTVGDRPTVIAARVAELLGLPGNSAAAAAIARDKQQLRERLRASGLPGPWFVPAPIDARWESLLPDVSFPCVVKPVALSGSRGVMRANDAEQLGDAWRRLQALLRLPDIQVERNAAHQRVLIEGFIPGREFAVEGLLHHGAFTALAVFDKPDPLDGPFFEETIYLTPSSLPPADRERVCDAVAHAAAAIGLWHGPIHAECRVNREGVFVLEVAARPIGGLCARALKFVGGSGARLVSLEELLLRHAMGESPAGWARETAASGVMMIPIPRRGVFHRVSGVDAARSVDGVEDLVITAKPDQLLVPLPEGASYLGFIFARGETAAAAEKALREAHRRLTFSIEAELRVVQSPHGAMQSSTTSPEARR